MCLSPHVSELQLLVIQVLEHRSVVFPGADPTKGSPVCQHHWVLALQVTLPCQATSGLKTQLPQARACKAGCSLNFSHPTVVLQFPILAATEVREKTEHFSSFKTETPLDGRSSPPLNTGPPKKSTFHYFNFVFSLLSSHWLPSPTALQLPVSTPITNPFFSYLSILPIQIHTSFTPALSLSITWMLPGILSEENLEISANYMAVKPLIIFRINFFFNPSMILAQWECPCSISS